MVAGRVEQVTTAGGVQVEEDAGHDNDLLLEAGLEEVEAVLDGLGQAFEVEPQVKGRVGHELDGEAHVAQALDHVVALVAEVALQGLHLGLDQAGLQHGDGRLLEGDVGATVKVGAARADAVFFLFVGRKGGLVSLAHDIILRFTGYLLRLDEFLGAQDPGHTPTGKTEALGQTVNDEHVVIVDIKNVFLLFLACQSASLGSITH